VLCGFVAKFYVQVRNKALLRQKWKALPQHVGETATAFLFIFEQALKIAMDPQNTLSNEEVTLQLNRVLRPLFYDSVVPLRIQQSATHDDALIAQRWSFFECSKRTTEHHLTVKNTPQ
jgi:hypothetical protein